MGSSELGWPQYPPRKGSTWTKWVFIGLPILLFLVLGIYFIVVDFNAFSELAHTGILKNETQVPRKPEKTWMEPSNGLMSSADYTTKKKSNDYDADMGLEEDPGLVVNFDYVDLDDEDLNQELLITPNVNRSQQQTLIILKNDDTGRKIYLKSSSVIGLPAGKVVRDETWSQGFDQIIDGTPTTETPKTETAKTTSKPFVYSPTVPKKVKPEEATTKKYEEAIEASRCFSTKLSFCEGIVPYDVVQLPDVFGVKRYNDLASILPYFQMIIDSGCSLRAREFICSVLEPECKPEGQRQAPPCKLNCQVVLDDCKDFILQNSELSKVFDCSRYPDWDENSECVNFSKGQCKDEEYQCSDGSCIPLKWVCDGVHDCPGSKPSFDESNCEGCTENEFRCVDDGKCIPQLWKCDGQIDCTDHSDELFC